MGLLNVSPGLRAISHPRVLRVLSGWNSQPGAKHGTGSYRGSGGSFNEHPLHPPPPNCFESQHGSTPRDSRVPQPRSWLATAGTAPQPLRPRMEGTPVQTHSLFQTPRAGPLSSHLTRRSRKIKTMDGPGGLISTASSTPQPHSPFSRPGRRGPGRPPLGIWHLSSLSAAYGGAEPFPLGLHCDSVA